jgi:hypothetical protein
LFSGGGAPHGRRDPHVTQPQTVVFGHTCRLVGEPGAVKGREEHVTAAVSGEDAAGAIASVRRRGEAEDQDTRVGGAEPGHGPAPINLIAEGRTLFLRDLLAPCDKARAGPTA